MRGGAREQYCGTCGALWPFERVRCGNCGTKNQGHLHYYNVDDDFAHRVQVCDECGGYQRVVFQQEARGGCVMEVEDVVMAKLDHVAHEQRFAEEMGARPGLAD